MPDSANFRLFNPDSMAKPAAGYSQVAEVTGGKLVYIAGQIALDTSGNLVGKDDFRAQVEQVFKNLNAAVVAAGGSFHDVIKLNYYVTDITMLPAVRAIRDEYVDTARPPASTAVQVPALAMPGLMIEIEAWAICDD